MIRLPFKKVLAITSKCMKSHCFMRIIDNSNQRGFTKLYEIYVQFCVQLRAMPLRRKTCSVAFRDPSLLQASLVAIGKDRIVDTSHQLPRGMSA